LGFEVKENGHVSVNHDHNRFGHTDTNGNPSKAKSPCGMTVHSIFKRLPHHSKAPKSEIKGDNCPLIYALKGLDGLHTTSSEIKKLIVPGKRIIQSFLSENQTDFDVILPMPSKHMISLILARRIHRLIPSSALVSDGLRKATVRQVYQQLESNYPGHNAFASISKQLKDMEGEVGLDGLFSIKKIPTNLRRSISPVVLTKSIPEDASKILLVDDLFSSGATLFGARDLLERYIPNIQIESLCLFSPYRGKIKR
jgi:hypothetical protein